MSDLTLEQVVKMLRTFEVGILRLEPGDTVMLKSTKEMDVADMASMAKCGRMIWPDNKVVVLPPDVTVSVTKLHPVEGLLPAGSKGGGTT